MLPEVEKFFTAYHNTAPLTEEETNAVLDNAYAALRKKIQENPNNDHYYAMRSFERVVLSSWETNTDGRKTKAWATLAEETEDPMVKYIAGGNHRLRDEYPDYLSAVLRALPATLEELDQLANENGWCNDYDNIVLRAQRGGHLPKDDFDKDSEARGELLEFFRELSIRRGNTRKLFALVEKVVAESVAAQNSGADTESEAATTA